MANAIFDGLEKAISDVGSKVDGSVDLSELSLIGTGDERSIIFSLFGSNFIFTPEGEVVSVDGTEEDPETYALAPEMRNAVQGFLKWRLGFVGTFGL